MEIWKVRSSGDRKGEQLASASSPKKKKSLQVQSLSALLLVLSSHAEMHCPKGSRSAERERREKGEGQPTTNLIATAEPRVRLWFSHLISLTALQIAVQHRSPPTLWTIIIHGTSHYVRMIAFDNTHTHTQKKKKKGTKFTCLITLLGQDGCNERAYLTPTTLEQQRFRKAGTFDAVLFFFGSVW